MGKKYQAYKGQKKKLILLKRGGKTALRGEAKMVYRATESATEGTRGAREKRIIDARKKKVSGISKAAQELGVKERT